MIEGDPNNQELTPEGNLDAVRREFEVLKSSELFNEELDKQSLDNLLAEINLEELTSIEDFDDLLDKYQTLSEQQKELIKQKVKETLRLNEEVVEDLEKVKEEVAQPQYSRQQISNLSKHERDVLAREGQLAGEAAVKHTIREDWREEGGGRAGLGDYFGERIG